MGNRWALFGVWVLLTGAYKQDAGVADVDKDGFEAEVDRDDSNADVFPGAEKV